MFIRPLEVDVSLDLEKLLNQVTQAQREGNLFVSEYAPGQTHDIKIPGSSANYTLALNPDGKGELQRTMAKNGALYASVRSERETPGVTLEIISNKIEIDNLEDEPFFMPIFVGTEEGPVLQAVFFYMP